MTKEQRQYRKEIKAAYRNVSHAISKGKKVDPYFFDWTKYFSPIESMAWGVIREIGMPMYPEYPTCGYFLDFADPIEMIGVELDGAQFHNAKNDMKRDLRLWKAGWLIFRITGKEMNAMDIHDLCDKRTELEELQDDCIEEKMLELKKEWINKTGDGVLHCIVNRYYDKKQRMLNNINENEIYEALKQHTYLPMR